MRKVQPQLIGSSLEAFFKSPDIARKVAEGNLPNTWREIVGPKVAEYTRQIRLVKDVMYVHIDSSVLRSELQYRQVELVNRVNAECQMKLVSRIVFQ